MAGRSDGERMGPDVRFLRRSGRTGRGEHGSVHVSSQIHVAVLLGLVIWERRDHPGLESFLFISVMKSSNFIWPWASEGVVNMDSLEPFREQFLLN